MEVLVPVLLDQLASITTKQAEQKIRLVVGVAADVRSLGANLRVIQKVLEDAENKRVTDEAVELWLKEFRDVSYKMDNVLDEWNTALIKAKIEKEESVLVEKKVRCFIPFPSCCFRPFQKIRLWHDIAFNINDLNKTLDDIVKRRGGYGFDLASGTVLVEGLTTTSFADVPVIHGRDKEKDDLLNYLLEEGNIGEENPRVISLVGMTGIGKTALALHVYKAHAVQDHFDVLIWVHVSNSFDPTRVAKAIIESIVEGSADIAELQTRSADIAELQTLMTKINKLISKQKFFLVLDDVWTEESETWKPFKNALKSGARGSRILVTTRNHKVSRMVGGESSDHTIILEVLSDEDTWSIFKNKVLVKKDEIQFQLLEDFSRKLKQKCRGLPLAAKTLGSLMCDQEGRLRREDILKRNLWGEENVKKGLLLSYYDLPLAMKRCFLYCSFFPRHYPFSRDELVYMWMAHGYVNPEVNGEMELTAESYFENLVMRSLFQDFEKDKNDGMIKSCKMHEIVHGFAQSMTSSECFAIDVDVDEEPGINFEIARHVSLTLTENRSFPESVCNAKDLRTLWLNLKGYSDNNLLRNLFHQLKCLRALIVKNIRVQKLPKEVENLIHLRLLDLSDNECLRELPETLSNLCNLQTLDVSRCAHLVKLPQRMGKLTNLRHLILDNFHLMNPIPKGIGRLTSLRTLTQFIVGCKDDHEGCTLGELKKLKLLRGALTIKGLGNAIDVSKAKEAQLKEKEDLCHLSLSFVGIVEENRGVNDKLVLTDLEPPPNLETLEIISYKSTMYPNWITSLDRLERLQLRLCDKLECLPPLGELLSLKSLEIESANGLKKVGVEFLGTQFNEKKDKESRPSSLILFPNLIRLVFRELLKWAEWDGIGETREEGGVTIMPRLHFLKIENCPMLNSLPGFIHTATLKELKITEITECPNLRQLGKMVIGEE